MHSALSMNIAGAVRNGGQALSETLARVDMLRARLQDSRVIIATNDNTDDTDQILDQYASDDAAVEILRLDGLSDQVPERVDRITAARNALLSQIFVDEDVLPLTLFLDMDGPNVGLDPDAVLTAAIRQSPQWDAVFANSSPAYYDLYALRCKGWCDEDVWQIIHSARKPMFGRRKWRHNLVKSMIHDRQYHIPKDCPLISVDSAFGGAGLYKSQALRGLSYTCRDEDGRLVCEHVLLHKEMRARGAKLFIDPGLTVHAPKEHLSPDSGAPLPLHLQSQLTGRNVNMPNSPLTGRPGALLFEAEVIGRHPAKYFLDESCGYIWGRQPDMAGRGI